MSAIAVQMLSLVEHKLDEVFIGAYEYRQGRRWVRVTKRRPIVTEVSRLDADLGFDTVDVLELIMAIEDEFGIVISDRDVDALERMSLRPRGAGQRNTVVPR